MSYTIQMAEYQRQMIVAAMQHFRATMPPEYRALEAQPSEAFGTMRKEFDVLLEMFDDLPTNNVPADCVHGFCL
jgi:hypothetical protein